MLSYGEGHDNVDEEAARIFASSDQPNYAKGSCVWLTSSSRLVKLCVLFSILLLLTSVASLALALLLPVQFNFREKIEKGHVISSRTNSSKSDAVIEFANSTSTINSTDPPSAFPLYKPSNWSTPRPTADPTPRPSATLIAKVKH
ncbi:hypothetical protein ACHAW5_000750 [Stephanodiscus triporus]|uniref:Uncharacterized protein n=1 Tax=Stephanodiscus triporus TaxID=2934178 RepID=A0ABD3QM68_9STRA